jgi:phosphatidylserine decarboxylase
MRNVRKIVPIDSPQLVGRVMAVCFGAMMVGSIKTTVEEGEPVQRGQEFAFRTPFPSFSFSADMFNFTL